MVSGTTSSLSETAFVALGDGTRRQVLELLRDGELSVRELADRLPVSQPAVSQHLRALRDARLVVARPEGARRLYSIDPSGLVAVRLWVESFWDDALSAFVDYVEDQLEEPVEEPDDEK